MFYIGVCEKKEDGLKNTCEMLRRYLLERPKIQGRICEFTSATQVIHCAEILNVCFLNSNLCKVDSVEVAKQLLKRNPNVRIIFLSGRKAPNRAIEAYQIHAEQYFVKPIEEKKIFEAVDVAIKKEEKRLGKRIALNSTEGVLNLYAGEVLFAKCTGHRVYYYLRDGREIEGRSSRISFAVTTAPMLKCGFLRCHDSYIVNISAVEQITPDGLLICNGDIVPLSNLKYRYVKEMFQLCVPT